MTCPDNFEVNPLHIAANGTGERAKVKAKDLKVVIDCCLTNDPLDRELGHRLDFKGGTVNRLALFELLNRHAKSHERGPAAQRANPSEHDGSSLADLNKQFKADGERIRRTEPTGDLAQTLKDYFDNTAMTKEGAFSRLCIDNGINPSAYAGKGFGLQRMALGNELRNRLKKGQSVKIGEQVIK